MALRRLARKPGTPDDEPYENQADSGSAHPGPSNGSQSPGDGWRPVARRPPRGAVAARDESPDPAEPSARPVADRSVAAVFGRHLGTLWTGLAIAVDDMHVDARLAGEPQHTLQDEDLLVNCSQREVRAPWRLTFPTFETFSAP